MPKVCVLPFALFSPCIKIFLISFFWGAGGHVEFLYMDTLFPQPLVNGDTWVGLFVCFLVWGFVCLFVLAKLRGMWDLSSQARYRTHMPCSGRAESYALDRQGSPPGLFSTFC